VKANGERAGQRRRRELRRRRRERRERRRPRVRQLRKYQFCPEILQI